MQEKTINLIFALCFGRANVRKAKFKHLWQFMPALKFFGSIISAEIARKLEQ